MTELLNELSTPRALRIFQRKRVPITCLSSDAVGNCVSISGNAVGNTYQVCTADPSTSVKMPAVGVLISKTSPTSGTVQIFGELRDIYTGLSHGQLLYVGADSRLTHTRPSSGIVQCIGEAFDSSIAFIWPFGFGGGGGSRLYQRPLTGARNGSNRVFTTPEKFIPDTIKMYHDGRMLRRSLTGSVTDGDYRAEESGGAGTGFDSVVFLSFSPVEYSWITADYDTTV